MNLIKIMEFFLLLFSILAMAADPEPIKTPMTSFALMGFKEKVVIFGHDSPDPDAVFSALGLAEYLTEEQKYFDLTGRMPKPNRTFQATIVDNLPPQAEFIYLTVAGFPINAGPLQRIPKAFNSPLPKNIKFFMTDHNDPVQSLPYLKTPANADNIEGIIDHHVMTDFGSMAINKLKQKGKIAITEIIGSTCTHVANLFSQFEKKYKKDILSQKTARALWGGIVADTTNFTSEATKPIDKEMAAYLVAKGKITNPKGLTTNLLEVKYDLKNLSEEQIIFLDFKQLPLSNAGKDKNDYVFFGLSEVNEKYIGPILSRSKALMEQARASKKEWTNVKGFFFGVANIDKNQTYLFLPSEKEKQFALKVFKVNGQTPDRYFDSDKNILILDGHSSRKSHFAKPIQAATFP